MTLQKFILRTEEDIKKVFFLYTAYRDEVEQCKIVSVSDIQNKYYTLAVNSYIDKKEIEAVSPDEVCRQYFEAYNAVLEAEEKMKGLLREGGYVNV